MELLRFWCAGEEVGGSCPVAVVKTSDLRPSRGAPPSITFSSCDASGRLRLLFPDGKPQQPISLRREAVAAAIPGTVSALFDFFGSALHCGKQTLQGKTDMLRPKLQDL